MDEFGRVSRKINNLRRPPKSTVVYGGGTLNPLVEGSNPSGPTNLLNGLALMPACCRPWHAAQVECSARACDRRRRSPTCRPGVRRRNDRPASRCVPRGLRMRCAGRVIRCGCRRRRSWPRRRRLRSRSRPACGRRWGLCRRSCTARARTSLLIVATGRRRTPRHRCAARAAARRACMSAGC